MSKQDELLEAVADIAYSAGHRGYYGGDSRADIQSFISWAQEFQYKHRRTDWGEHGDYIGEIDRFTAEKIGDAPAKFTVIVEHIDGQTRGRTIVAIVVQQPNPKSASDEACLWLIRDRQGVATPLYVVNGDRHVTVCDDAAFDAEDYDETITCAGYLSHQDLAISD